MIPRENMAELDCLNDSLKNELDTLSSLLVSAKFKLAHQYSIDTVDDVGMRRKLWLNADLKVKVGKYHVCISKDHDSSVDVRLVCYRPTKKGGVIVDFWGQNAAEGWPNCRKLVCLEDIIEAIGYKLKALENAETRTDQPIKE